MVLALTPPSAAVAQLTDAQRQLLLDVFTLLDETDSGCIAQTGGFLCAGWGGTPLTYSVESAFVLEIDQSGGILDQIPCIFLPPTHLDYLPHLPHRKKSRLHARRPRSGSAVSGCEFCWHFCGAWETTIYTSVSYTWDWQSLQADHWV